MITDSIDGDSAFDAAGNLLVPMELWDHDMDDSGADSTPQVLRPVTASMTYQMVKDAARRCR